MADGMENMFGTIVGVALLGSLIQGGKKKTTTTTKKKNGETVTTTEREGGGLFGNWGF